MFKINPANLNLFSKLGNQELVGINFSGNNLKISHIHAIAGKKEVVNLASIDVSGLNDTDISKEVQNFIGALKGKKVFIIDIIPAHLVITKNIEIPSIDPREIKEILSLQAGRHTPYSREEIIVDHVEIGTYKHSYTKVLLVIVARNVIKRHYEILARARFKSDKVFFAPEGMALSVSKILKLDQEKENIYASLVHVDESFTDFSIIAKNRVVFMRSIPIGALQLKSEKEIYHKKFVEEIKRSLEAYLSEDIGKSPNMLVLTGAAGELNETETLLNNNLHLPIKVLTHLNEVKISELARATLKKDNQVSFSDVLEPVLNFEQAKIDLAPEEIKVRKSIEDRGKELIKSGIYVLTIFVAIFFILVSKLYFKSAQLDKLNKKYANVNLEAQKLEKDYAKIGAIKNYLNSRGYSLDVLVELYSILPEDTVLSEVRYDAEKFSVKGSAAAMSSVFEFVSSMEKTKYFKEVKTRYTSKRKDGARELTDFEIVSQIEKGAD